MASTQQRTQWKGKGGKGDTNWAYDKVQRRAAWLNDRVFPDRPIDQDAMAAMVGMGVPRAMELFKEIEEKADELRNPSGYLTKAARREGFGPPEGGKSAGKGGGGGKGRGENYEHEKIQRRASWLNSNVFVDRPIDDNAIAAMMGMGMARAMELFKEIEEKADSMRNPSGYLKVAAQREGFGPPQGHSAPQAAAHREIATPRAVGGGGRHDTVKVQKRASWLNDKVFVSNPIDEDAIAAMIGMGAARAMELFKEIEEKADTIKNPSGYLKASAKREGFGPPEGYTAPPPPPRAEKGKGKGKRTTKGGATGPDAKKLSSRVEELNGQVFPDNPIDDEALSAVRTLPMARAMELLQDLENKAGDINNPSGYLKVAVQRESGGKGRGIKRKLPDAPFVPSKAALADA